VAIEYYLAAVAAFQSGEQLSALSLLTKATTSNPMFYEAHYFLGMIHGCRESFAQAIHHLHAALTCTPHSSAAHLLLGKAYCHLNRHPEGIACLQRAVALSPDSTETACALALAYSSANETEQAIRLLESYCHQGDNIPLGHFTLALLFTQTAPDLALRHYRQALDLKPDYHEAGLNYAVLLLSLGNFELGWQAYEHRIPWLGLNCELTGLPRWHGEALAGRTILVVTEQGFGDSIQFIRYARLLKQEGATVYLLCTNNLPLRSLLATAPGVDGTIGPDEPVPHLDCYIPLMSLPLRFGTRLESIPADTGYVTADPDAVSCWHERLKEYKELKVGVVWAGGRALKSNANRSISLPEFSSLFDCEGVTFFSLQVGSDALTSDDAARYGANLVDLTGHLHNFGDTAALIANLDLVISVDTAVAHLAGAMGVPVWLLLYYPAEWRWLRDWEGSPWYPTMKIFRQHVMMHWAQPLAEVRHRLTNLMTT
jgi:tetratricopeptide (TPR) repeat protein